MWIRMLPGLAISVALAVFFCLDDNKPAKRPPSVPVLVTEERSAMHAYDEPAVCNGFFRNPQYNATPRPFHSVEAQPSAPSRTTGSTVSVSTKHTREKRVETTASRENSTTMGEIRYAMVPSSREYPLERQRPAATQRTRDRKSGEFIPARHIRLSNKIASDNALANPRIADAHSAAGANGFPAGALPPMAVSSTYNELPPRGVYAWGAMERFSEEQRLREEARSLYKHDGALYSAGLKYDWSIDTVLGLSVDLIDSTVKSKHVYDTRKNDITGYRLNLHYDGLLREKYLVSATGFFGSYETKGSGRIGLISPMGVVTHAWREGRHDSDMYGFSGRFGVPLIWGDDIKILNEIGVDYKRLRSKGFGAEVEGLSSITMPSVNSTSLSIPLLTTVKRDFMQCWGLITPRLNTGMTFELDDGAVGVRTLNAPAASLYYDPVTWFHASGIQNDDSQKMFFQLGVGVDIKTVGGWELSADYERHMAEKYSRNRFRLELGRCF